VTDLRKLFIWLGLFFVLALASPVRAQVPPVSLVSGRGVDTSAFSLINEVNLLRAANGLPAYLTSPILMSVAQQQAQYMAAAGVSHYGPGGSLPWQRGLSAGYPLAGDLTLGGFYSENIIAGNEMSVQQAVAAWQGDAPHLTTMLSPNLTEIGAGVALVGNYVYYVIDCASPTTSGQPQAYTPAPGSNPVTAAPLVVNTLVPATPLPDGQQIHEVRPGETLWLIAVSYGVKIVDLRRVNNLTEYQALYPGQKLFIRLAPTSIPLTATQPPTATLAPTLTPLPTATAQPSPSPSPAPLPPPPAVSNFSLPVLALIILAALGLALVFVRSARQTR
jgi:uncharacterized protein YkwD/LysM repeat protein